MLEPAEDILVCASVESGSEFTVEFVQATRVAIAQGDLILDQQGLIELNLGRVAVNGRAWKLLRAAPRTST